MKLYLEVVLLKIWYWDDGVFQGQILPKPIFTIFNQLHSFTQINEAYMIIQLPEDKISVMKSAARGGMI